MKVATAGQKGLTVHLQLRHPPNPEPFSGLQAACLLFVVV
jgi:hypothetical protein